MRALPSSLAAICPLALLAMMVGSPGVFAQVAGDAASVQAEVRKIHTELDKARAQLGRERGTPCATEIGPSISDVNADLSQVVDGRTLERVRTELKWMARFSGHVCSAKITATLTKGHVSAERAMLAFDLEEDRIRAAQEAAWAAEDAALAARERARLEAEAIAAHRAREEQVKAARAQVEAAHALVAEKADCWQQDDPGCGIHRDGERALNRAEFTAFIKGVEDAWASERVSFIAGHKRAYFTTRQLAQIIEQMSASEHLTVVKLLAERIIDPENYAQVEKTFWSTDWPKVVGILSSQRPVR